MNNLNNEILEDYIEKIKFSDNIYDNLLKKVEVEHKKEEKYANPRHILRQKIKFMKHMRLKKK